MRQIYKDMLVGVFVMAMCVTCIKLLGPRPLVGLRHFWPKYGADGRPVAEWLLDLGLIYLVQPVPLMWVSLLLLIEIWTLLRVSALPSLLMLHVVGGVMLLTGLVLDYLGVPRLGLPIAFSILLMTMAGAGAVIECRLRQLAREDYVRSFAALISSVLCYAGFAGLAYIIV